MIKLTSFDYKRTFRLLAISCALIFFYVFFLHLFHPSSFTVAPAASGPYKVVIDSLIGACLATFVCVGLINTVNMMVLFSKSTGLQTLTIILGILLFIPLFFIGMFSFIPMLIYSGIRYKLLKKRELKQNDARYTFIQPYFDRIQKERKNEIEAFMKQNERRDRLTAAGWYVVLIVAVFLFALIENFGILFSLAIIIGYIFLLRSLKPSHPFLKLNDSVDQELYLSVLFSLSKLSHPRGYDILMSSALNKLGMFSEAKQMLAGFEFVTYRSPKMHVLYFTAKFDTESGLGESKMIEVTRISLTKLLVLPQYKKTVKTIQRILKAIDAYFAFERGDYATCKEIYDYLYTSALTLNLKVKYAFLLGKTAVQLGNKEEATDKFNFVIQNGGCLYYVTAAKEILEQISKN